MSEQNEWLTVHDAAAILRVSTRQVHRYAEESRLVTRRAGRRVLFNRASVVKLADDLAVDIRPAAQTRDLISPELARYLSEQAEQMRQQGETQASIDRRLAEIERRLAQPPPNTPRWLVGLLVAILVVALAIFIVVILRGF